VMEPFLLAFVRTTELFADTPGGGSGAAAR